MDEPTSAQESSSSSAIILRDQDGTISTLRDSAAGTLHSILRTAQLNSSSMKVNFYNPARSAASRRVRGLIPLVSFSKGGAVLLGATRMTIKTRMNLDCTASELQSKCLILPPGDLWRPNTSLWHSERSHQKRTAHSASKNSNTVKPRALKTSCNATVV